MIKFISFLVIPALATIAIYVAYLSTNDPVRFMHQPFSATDIAPLSAGKVIVITGASSGLGLSSAKLLAEAGTARAVVMACRNMKKCSDARETILSSIRDSSGRGDGSSTEDGVHLITAELDLASLSSVKSFAIGLQKTLAELQTFRVKINDDGDGNGSDKVEQNVPQIDVLLNNAGIMGVEYSLNSQTNLESQMHVNHLGHFALTSILRNNLIQGGDDGGRVVSVSSLAGALPHLNLDDVNFTNTPLRSWILKHAKMLQGMIAYSASKRANLVFTHALNAKYGHSLSSIGGITAVAAHPGYSRTSLLHNGWVGVPKFLKDVIAANTVGSMSSDEGALPQIRAALDVENVRADDYVGPLFLVTGRPIVVGSSMKSFHHLFWPISAPTQVAEKLWKWSEDAIGWKFHDGPSKLVE